MRAPRVWAKASTAKKSGLPVGVSQSWVRRKGRQPYFRYTVNYKEHGISKIKTFYVGVAPCPFYQSLVRCEAIDFRHCYERGCYENS